jgi:hypothetical protein
MRRKSDDAISSTIKSVFATRLYDIGNDDHTLSSEAHSPGPISPNWNSLNV